MYHVRFQKNHYEAGYRWGGRLYQNGKIIRESPTFVLTRERRDFTEKSLPLYQKYYPEILEEIRGLADGQRSSYEDFCSFLLSMYCFEFRNRCTCFAFQDKEHILFGRNSDFLTELEKLYMNCLYRLDDAYAFNGNTTAFIEMEDGINEYGLAAGLTFIYPKEINPGLNAGMLVRFLLEKCRTTKEVIRRLGELPIASQQTLTVIDSTGDMAVIECNCHCVKVIGPADKEPFVAAANLFVSQEMKKYNQAGIDNWRAEERYDAACHALKGNREHFSLNLAKDILAGKYGFMCQYDRKTGADTVWSVIYDCKGGKIYRAEGNPGRKRFVEDDRMKFLIP